MKIIIAGDFCPRTRTASLIDEGKFDYILGDVKPIIESADYSIVNLECPVVDANLHAKPILKEGGNLCCKKSSVDAIKHAGFHGVTLANNHIYDYGKEGLVHTVQKCKEEGLDVVGVGENNEDAAKILYKQVADRTIAIINCCEHEFSVADESSPGANPLNPARQFYAIREARLTSDYVIVIVHGGHEHYQLPSPRMKEIYRFFIDCGADVVINHHQHCFSGYEIYKAKPIFYGLGNFFFNKDGSYEGIWTEGIMVELCLEDSTTFKLYPYIQCGKEPIVRLMTETEREAFNKKISDLNAVINDDKALREEHKKWMKKSALSYELALSPLSNNILLSAAARKLIPTFLSKKKIIKLLNYIECESHRDKLLFAIKNYLRI